jgi:FemAB-related protein (PEP-CTERM system-associated)
MAIEVLRNEDRERWDEYVTNSGSSTCYHLTGWKSVIERSFGHKTYYLFSEKDSNINGVLPLIQLKSMLFGNFMISLPYVNYGGICSDNEDISDRLLQEAGRIATDTDADHIELRNTRPMRDGVPVKTTKVSMRLELPQNPEALWKTFPSKLRSQIRRPEKEGMYVTSGGIEELDSFYAVFLVNMRDLGTPVYSREFFRTILKEFPDTAWICTVYTKSGDPAAAGFLVSFKDTLEIPWASSLRSYNYCSPNMLLYWSVLELACKKGYRAFDFGRSTPGEGTFKFKEQWGARPVQLYWHYWMKNGGHLPQLNPKNPKYQMAIKIWKKLPVAVTKIIGPAIVKNLP